MLKPPVVKPILAKVGRDLILCKLGTLNVDDREAVRRALAAILGG